MPLNALYAQLRQLQVRLAHLPTGGADYYALLNQISVLKASIRHAEGGLRDWSQGL